MGGLYRRMPVTFVVYVIGALALAGIFPLAGFWSKDEILAEAQHLQPGIYGLLTIAAFLTAFYMGRQVWMVFFGEARSAAGLPRPREFPPDDRPPDPSGGAFGAGRGAQPAGNAHLHHLAGPHLRRSRNRRFVQLPGRRNLDRTGAGGYRAGLLPLRAEVPGAAQTARCAPPGRSRPALSRPSLYRHAAQVVGGRVLRLADPAPLRERCRVSCLR